jgi:Cft2 family RNA processing exonuclease
MPEVFFQSMLRRAEIGANSYLIDTGKARLVLDTGMHPKGKGLDCLPDYAQIDTLEIDAAIVTHAHLDHVGSLPVFMRRHPEAQVYLSDLTGELADAMLHNSSNVMTLQREQDDIKEYPLFTHREVDRMARQWLRPQVGRSFALGETKVRAEFFHAGHLPGSCGVMLEIGKKRVFYTGDVHFEDQTLSKAASFPEKDIDVLIMECTRGASQRAEAYTREGEATRLAETIMRAIERGGSVLMPVFAVGKTQEMLLMLNALRRAGKIATKIPVHIGGLSTRMTQIVDSFAAKETRRGVPGFKILESMEGIVRTKKGERDITSAPGRIYALSSGMMSENTVSNNFAFRFIDNPKNVVAFVGYADPESPAGAILRTAPGDRVRLHPSYDTVPLHAEVASFDFSGHAPREALIDYACRVNPKKILLVHGDQAALDWMAATLSIALPETEVIIPMPGERVAL